MAVQYSHVYGPCTSDSERERRDCFKGPAEHFKVSKRYVSLYLALIRCSID